MRRCSWARLVIGGLVAALTGLVVGVPSLRLKGDYLAIVTLGFGEIIRVILQNTPRGGRFARFLGGDGYTNLFWAYGLAAVTIYFVLTLVYSTYGRGFIAVHDDEVAAEAMGITPPGTSDGVRHRRVLCRHRRRALRALEAVSHTGGVRLHQVHRDRG